eukprot:363762-Chlamydomonas_euryale.AAC.5
MVVLLSTHVSWTHMMHPDCINITLVTLNECSCHKCNNTWPRSLMMMMMMVIMMMMMMVMMMMMLELQQQRPATKSTRPPALEAEDAHYHPMTEGDWHVPVRKDEGWSADAR